MKSTAVTGERTPDSAGCECKTVYFLNKLVHQGSLVLTSPLSISNLFHVFGSLLFAVL
jgi:hypothetical protein